MPVMVEKTAALKSVLTSIGEAFTNAASPSQEPDAQPEAAAKDPGAAPKPPTPPAL